MEKKKDLSGMEEEDNEEESGDKIEEILVKRMRNGRLEYLVR